MIEMLASFWGLRKTRNGKNYWRYVVISCLGPDKIHPKEKITRGGGLKSDIP